jgi:hypothetical protein
MSMNFRQINFILNPTAAQVSSNHLRYLYCLILLMVLITRPPCEIPPLSTTRCYIHVDILEPDTAFLISPDIQPSSYDTQRKGV